MTNLPKSLRDRLKDEFSLYEPKVLSKQVSAIDGTIKYLWELKGRQCRGDCRNEL